MTSANAPSGVNGGPTGRSTIGDVAAAAGVSRATVSRVMNNQSTVNAELAERVRRVAADLRYSPSNVARSLSLGRTQTIAVVVPDLGNPMFQSIIRGLTEAAALEGYRVMITETDEDPTAEATVARESRARCDAVVLISPAAPEETVAGLLGELQPAVLLGRRVDGVPHGLAFDFAAGVELAIEHLTELGHRDLVYLNGPTNSPGNRARLEGFRRVEQAQPNLRIAHLTCGSRMADGYEAAERVLAGQASAVIAYNDLVAFGLLARLNETGVAVPQDISVIGFDDIALAGYAVPPLTTLGVPEAQLGVRAWESLRAAIAGEDAPPQTDLGPTLVRRTSTGPVPPRKAARRQVAPRTITAIDWHRDGDADVLMGDGLPLLRYERGERMSRVHSPRPYAHPIHTLAGVPLTTAGARDHRHQHGLSLALPDVNGTSYWGGRTFLRDLGPTLLANHGRQRVDERRADTDGGPERAVLREKLTWEDEYGDSWLTEDRLLSGQLLPQEQYWRLTWRSLLHADHTDITFASPGTKGRLGAGYGGIFWRFDGSSVLAIFSDLGAGEPAVHGRTAQWVAVVRGAPRAARTTVILRQLGPELLPWFCRVSDYTGIGPSLAWDAERVLAYGDSLDVGLDAVMLDREVAPDEVGPILDSLPDQS